MGASVRMNQAEAFFNCVSVYARKRKRFPATSKPP